MPSGTLCTAEQYNSSVFEGSIKLNGCGNDSIAWTEHWVFIAHGYWNESESEKYWSAPHYELIRMDRSNGEVVVLIKDIPLFDLQIYTSNEELYYVGFNYWITTKEPDEAYTCSFAKLDYNGKLREEKKQIFESPMYVSDYILREGILYLLTDKSIYEWNTNLDKLDLIYCGTSIENHLTVNHVIISDGAMFIQDQRRIMMINLLNKQAKYVCEIESDSSSDYYFELLETNRLDSRYHYIVVCNSLIYYDYDLGETIRLDLQTNEKTTVSNSEYYYHQISSDGALAYKVEDENGKTEALSEGIHLVYLNCFENNAVEFNLSRIEEYEIDSLIVFVGNHEYINCDFVYYGFIPSNGLELGGVNSLTIQ